MNWNTEIKREFIKSFAKSSISTFDIQIGLNLNVKDPFIKKIENETDYFIAAILNYSNTKIEGSVAMAFNEKALIHIHNNLFDESHFEYNEEMQDAVGEMLNIIYGSSKSDLNQNFGFELPMAIPQVVMGNSTGYDYDKKSVIIQPFTIGEDDKKMFIEFCME